jgi:histidyl-tRNA synthetase
VLDCKVPEDQPIIDTLPSILDYLDEGCKTHFEAVKRFLDERNISYTVRPRLVRGLDYYTRTTFEIVHGSLGAQNSVLGGGRYDGLAEALGSKVRAPGIGFSIGEDRLVMSVEEKHAAVDRLTLFIAPIAESKFTDCTLLARELRQSGTRVELGAPGKLKKLLEQANKAGAVDAMLVFDDHYELKNMETGEQQTLSRQDLVDKFTCKKL